MRGVIKFWSAALLLVSGSWAAGISWAEDMPGSADHPQIPRVAGASIYGYAHSSYDVGGFVKAVENNKLVVADPEGDRTRILYIAKPGDSPLMVQKNYETALADLGAVEEVFACRGRECISRFSTHLWGQDSIIETHNLPQARYLIGFAHNYKNPAYRYAVVTTDEAKFHVGVFTAQIASNNPNPAVRELTAVLVEVLGVEAFEATLEFVDAAQMQDEISRQGHVALYGIHFDHDKATLREESTATLQEIVAALQQDPALAIYVVGHTDGTGALDYNQGLSLRRAEAVVAALVSQGVTGSRLTPLGVGPAAPVATNDTEEGRGLNRRVELVKR